jgi:hypothetical protein
MIVTNINKESAFWVLWGTVLMFCITAVYSISNGPKGNDQHWYLAATESIIKEHTVRSNNIFPVLALKGEVKKNPFIHNIPAVYLASLPAFLAGSFLGWFIFNMMMAGLIYLMFYKLLKNHFQKNLSLLLAAIVIIFPFNIMYATQALSEAFLGFLIIATVYLYYKRSTFKSQHYINICISILFAVMAFSRTNFILLIFVIPFLLRKSDSLKENSRNILIYLSSFCVTYLVLAYLLPGSFINILKDVLLSYRPDDSSPMIGFSGKEPILLSDPDQNGLLSELIRLFWLKLVKGIKSQFLTFDPPSLFSFGIFNFLFFLSAVGFIIKRKTQNDVARYFFITLILFAIHFATAVVFDNNIRYLYPYFPVLFLNTFIIYKDDITYYFTKWRRSFNWIYSLIYLSFFLIGIVIVNQYLKEANDQKALREDIFKSVSSFIPENETIWTDNQNAIISYTLLPRDFLNAGSEYSDDELITMVDNTNAKWFFSSESSEIIDRLTIHGYEFIYVTKFNYKYESEKDRIIQVYRIKKANS